MELIQGLEAFRDQYNGKLTEAETAVHNLKSEFESQIKTHSQKAAELAAQQYVTGYSKGMKWGVLYCVVLYGCAKVVQTGLNYRLK